MSATHCAVGAIRMSTENSTEARQAEAALREYLIAEGHITAWSVPKWNDVLGRTAEEVRESMLLAAKHLRNDE